MLSVDLRLRMTLRSQLGPYAGPPVSTDTADLPEVSTAMSNNTMVGAHHSNLIGLLTEEDASELDGGGVLIIFYLPVLEMMILSVTSLLSVST